MKLRLMLSFLIIFQTSFGYALIDANYFDEEVKAQKIKDEKDHKVFELETDISKKLLIYEDLKGQLKRVDDAIEFNKLKLTAFLDEANNRKLIQQIKIFGSTDKSKNIALILFGAGSIVTAVNIEIALQNKFLNKRSFFSGASLGVVLFGLGIWGMINSSEYHKCFLDARALNKEQLLEEIKNVNQIIKKLNEQKFEILTGLVETTRQLRALKQELKNL